MLWSSKPHERCKQCSSTRYLVFEWVQHLVRWRPRYSTTCNTKERPTSPLPASKTPVVVSSSITPAPDILVCLIIPTFFSLLYPFVFASSLGFREICHLLFVNLYLSEYGTDGIRINHRSDISSCIFQFPHFVRAGCLAGATQFVSHRLNLHCPSQDLR